MNSLAVTFAWAGFLLPGAADNVIPPEQAQGHVSAALSDLQSADPAVRRCGAFALGAMGVEALPALRPLLAALAGDADDRVRELAAFALGNLGPQGAPAVAPLLAVLRNTKEKAGVRALAAQALGSSLYSVAGRAIGPLAEALRDKEDNVRLNAARALGSFGAKATGAVPRLIQMLKEKRPSIRGAVVSTLGEIGPDAAAAVPALKAMLRDADANVRERVPVALQKIDPKAASTVE